MVPDSERDIIIIRKPQDVANEVKYILSLVNPAFEFSQIKFVFDDTRKLFSGRYRGYRGCNTRYHDLDHTMMVFLAAVRLVHSLSLAR